MPATRTAVITGAGSERGIGRETALHLAAAGFAVAVLDIDGEAAERTAAVVAERHGVPSLHLAADVTDAASVDQAIGKLEASDLPAVGALVNNAGITRPTRFLDIRQEEWDLVFNVNVTGTYLVTQRVLPGMIERGYGRIVNLSSVSAERGGGVFGGSHYSAAKAAVLGLTRALAREVGPHGVVVNAVAPGLIDTDITGTALTGDRKEKLIADIPTEIAGAEIGWVSLISDPVVALLIGLLLGCGVCAYSLSMKSVERALSRGAATSGTILLFTGVAGSLGEIISRNGVGDIVAGMFQASSFSPLVLAWVVAALLRLAQGSGSVAAITSATLLLPVVGSLGLNPVLVVLAAAAGASFGGHVHDNTFWMFRGLLGLSTRGAFQVYTVAQSIMSIVALVLVLAASVFI